MGWFSFTAASASALLPPHAWHLLSGWEGHPFLLISFIVVNLAWKSHLCDWGLWEAELLDTGRFVMSGRLP
jgi:hypothetical protein